MPFVTVVILILTTILSGIAASQIYDLLKARGVFSDRSIVKSILIISSFLAALIILTFLSELVKKNPMTLRNFLDVEVHLWQVVLVVAAAVAVGFYAGRESRNIFAGRTVLRRLVFDFQDSPARHGWHLQGKPSYKRITDPIAGHILELHDATYRMDYRLDSKAQQGDMIEFSGKFGPTGLLYVGMAIEGVNDELVAHLWLQIRPGAEAPKEVINKREGWHQWMIFLKPVSEDSGWPSYRIDVKQAVRNTVGESGWTFKHLEYLRLRGELSVSSITILG